MVGNFPSVHLVLRFGTPEQIAEFGAPGVLGERTLAFGLTEPEHGSDATWMETTGTRSGDDWVITGEKRWNTGMHVATHDLVFARTSGSGGDPRGITAFIVPDADTRRRDRALPVDPQYADRSCRREVRLGAGARLGDPGEEGRGLEIAQAFVHENRLRQAASSLGAAQYCIDQSVDYARTRETFGAPLATRQAVQWPLVELHTEATMLRSLIRETAADLDSVDHMELSDHVSMCNYRANRLVLRRCRPGHAGARRYGLQPALAVRAHLPPPPPLPHHRGRGDSDATRRRPPVRVHRRSQEGLIEASQAGAGGPL